MIHPPWTISAATATDLQGILAIEVQSPSPWSRQQLASELASAGGCRLVARSGGDDEIVGFLLARAALDEAEILKLAVDRKFRRQGVASTLLAAGIDILRQRRLGRIHLEVRAANQAARTLYEKFSFEMTGSRPNYYTAPREDALCLTLSLR